MRMYDLIKLNFAAGMEGIRVYRGTPIQGFMFFYKYGYFYSNGQGIA